MTDIRLVVNNEGLRACAGRSVPLRDSRKSGPDEVAAMSGDGQLQASTRVDDLISCSHWGMFAIVDHPLR
jgi:hypothetical protein